MTEPKQAGSMLLPAPSTVCLLCAACGRLVTPCLVCASLLPWCGSLAWEICRKCKLRNPLGEQERRLLGFSPALALPLSMARRVQVAHVGRSACVMATHFQYLQMQETFADELAEDIPKTNARDMVDESCCRIFQKTKNGSDFPSIHLPFFLCEGMVKCARLTIDNQLLAAYDTNPNVKDSLVSHVCSCAGQMPVKDNVMEKSMQDLDQMPSTDKVADNCHACGGTCQTICWDMSQSNEAGLRRCQEQLLALHCAEALSADLNCTLYPVCNTIVSSSLDIVETDTCHLKLSNNCASRTVGSLSISILRLVNSFLEPVFKAWLVDKGAGSIENFQQFEDILATTENFLRNRVLLLQLQTSMRRALAAKKQAAKDHEAVLHQSVLKFTKQASLLKRIFAERVQEREEQFMKAVKPFVALLDQINLVLEFCYAEACSASFSQFSRFYCSANSEQFVKANDCVKKEEILEALRTAASLWLLLYHDVAHATGVIGDGLQ